jgi:hypothetical protein
MTWVNIFHLYHVQLQPPPSTTLQEFFSEKYDTIYPQFKDIQKIFSDKTIGNDFKLAFEELLEVKSQGLSRLQRFMKKLKPESYLYTRAQQTLIITAAEVNTVRCFIENFDSLDAEKFESCMNFGMGRIDIAEDDFKFPSLKEESTSNILLDGTTAAHFVRSAFSPVVTFFGGGTSAQIVDGLFNAKEVRDGTCEMYYYYIDLNMVPFGIVKPVEVKIISYLNVADCVCFSRRVKQVSSELHERSIFVKPCIHYRDGIITDRTTYSAPFFRIGFITQHRVNYYVPINEWKNLISYILKSKSDDVKEYKSGFLQKLKNSSLK